jgi:hypothetical protein
MVQRFAQTMELLYGLEKTMLHRFAQTMALLCDEGSNVGGRRYFAAAICN